MEYTTQLKPFVHQMGGKYKVLEITDIALHTSHKQATPSVARKIEKAFKTNQPGRMYAPIQKDILTDQGEKREFVIELIKKDPDLVRMIQQEEANGYKVLIAIPNEGIPIYAGKDTVEFMNSKNGKRIIRGLAKQESQDKI